MKKNNRTPLGWQIDRDLAKEIKEAADREGVKPGALLERIMNDFLNKL